MNIQEFIDWVRIELIDATNTTHTKSAEIMMEIQKEMMNVPEIAVLKKIDHYCFSANDLFCFTSAQECARLCINAIDDYKAPNLL